MENTIILAAFVIIPAIVILISIITGFKRNAYQSGFKLAFTILSVVISSLLARTIAQTLVDIVLTQPLDLFDANVLSYLNTANSAKDILGIAKALVAPAAFLVSFIVIKFLFFLINLVPCFLLSDKAILRRKSARTAIAVPDIDMVYSDETVKNDQEHANTHEDCAPYKTKTSKAINKAISIICCVLSAFLILSSLALPINAYTKYATTVINESEGIVELDADLEYAKDIIISINSHPTYQSYAFFNDLTIHSLETFKNHRGTTVSLSNALTSSFAILNKVSGWDVNAISPQNIYDLADLIENDPFAKDFVTSFVVELCDAWGRGESYIGIEPPDLNNPIMDIILKELSSMDDIVKVLRAVADVLKMADSLKFNPEELTIDSLKLITKELFNNITPDTVDFIKSMISEEMLSQVVDLPPSVAGHISNFTGFVLDGIVELKNNPEFSIDQTIEIIEKEAEALTYVVEMVSDPENIEPEKIVDAIIESDVISNTIQKITDNGIVTDPYQIADMIPQQFTDQVKETLDEHGISQNHEIYKSILALISK